MVVRYPFRNTEVAYLHPEVWLRFDNKDIVWLEISMYELFLVHKFETLKQLSGNDLALYLGYRGVHMALKITILDVFHG